MKNRIVRKAAEKIAREVLKSIPVVGVVFKIIFILADIIKEAAESEEVPLFN
jgi:hypothetical protein